MYKFLLNIVKPSWARVIMSIWYAGLIIAIFLLFNHTQNGDFLYLHL